MGENCATCEGLNSPEFPFFVEWELHLWGHTGKWMSMCLGGIVLGFWGDWKGVAFPEKC